MIAIAVSTDRKVVTIRDERSKRYLKASATGLIAWYASDPNNMAPLTIRRVTDANYLTRVLDVARSAVDR